MALSDTYNTAVGAITMPTTPGGAGIKDKTARTSATGGTKQPGDKSTREVKRQATGNDLTAGNSQMGSKDVSMGRAGNKVTAAADLAKRFQHNVRNGS